VVVVVAAVVPADGAAAVVFVVDGVPIDELEHAVKTARRATTAPAPRFMLV
jgi:hypothetical protein